MKFTKKNRLGLFAFFSGLFLGLYFISFQVVGYSLSHFPGDLGDGRLNLYFLEHAYKFFTGQVESLWDAPFIYPETNVLAFSDNLLGSAPLYALFRLFNIDTFTSYQLWFLVITILNYTASYFLLKQLFHNKYAAVLGAMIFTFSIALQSQMTHAQTFPRFAIPLVFLMLVKFKRNFNPSFFFLALLLLVYQIYCGIYLGFMLAIAVIIFLIILVLFNFNSLKKQLKKSKWGIKIAGSIIINLILLVPLMLPYMERARSTNLDHYWQIFENIPTIKSHFFSQSGSLLWDFLSKTATNYPSWWNHQIFAGAIATICFLLFVGIFFYEILFKKNYYKLKNNTIFYLAITAIITMLFYLRFGNFSAYIFIYFLPGFSAIRAIPRIINIELLFFAIATAYVFSTIMKKNNWLFFAVFLFFAGLLITDNYFYKEKSYRTEKSIAYKRINPLKNVMQNIPEGAVVSYEPKKTEGKVIYYHLDAMLAAQQCNLKTINGYTATSPKGYSAFWRNINAESRNKWLAMHELNIDTLYIIKSFDKYESVLIRNLNLPTPAKNKEKSKTERIKNQMEYIKSDKKWMEHIRQKAKKKGIPVDSMLKIDAIWSINQKQSEKNN